MSGGLVSRPVDGHDCWLPTPCLSDRQRRVVNHVRGVALREEALQGRALESTLLVIDDLIRRLTAATDTLESLDREVPT